MIVLGLMLAGVGAVALVLLRSRPTGEDDDRRAVRLRVRADDPPPRGPRGPRRGR
jgi:hypothetical protein